jgi:hypothetical protein
MLATKMNERIQELALQAGASRRAGVGGLVFRDAELKKFAELIVRECMACSTWVGKVNKNAIESIHTAQAINQRIKEHFGVN